MCSARTSQPGLVRFMAKQSIFTHRVGGRDAWDATTFRSTGDPASPRKGGNSRRSRPGSRGVFPEATISQSFTLKEIRAARREWPSGR